MGDGIYQKHPVMIQARFSVVSMREAQSATTKKLGGLEVAQVESPKRFQQLLVTKNFSTQGFVKSGY
jgi:hypothetical protein